MAADLEALKAKLAAAKAVHREAVKMIVGAKRVADDARRKLGEVQREYIAALPPSKRPKPRPARVEDPDANSVFPSSPPREEAA
jgi:hypothetical protein